MGCGDTGAGCGHGGASSRGGTTRPGKPSIAVMVCDRRRDRRGISPQTTSFDPMMADPKQPQFFASYLAARARTDGTHANIGSVGFGENFGFYTRREVVTDGKSVFSPGCFPNST